MLINYALYLEGIRNGLIQRGVIFSDIADITQLDYRSIFELGEQLAELSYFYSLMEYTGNMEPLFSEVGQTYKGFVRADAYKEFEEDILPMLSNLYGEDEAEFGIHSICDLEGVLGIVEDEPEEWVNEDVDAADMLIDMSELFDDPPDSPVQVVQPEFATKDVSIWELGTKEAVSEEVNNLEYSPRGTELFSISFPSEEEGNQETAESVEYVSHGTELFSIVLEGSSSGGASVESDFEDLFVPTAWEDDEEDMDEGSDEEEGDYVFEEASEDFSSWDEEEDDGDPFEDPEVSYEWVDEEEPEDDGDPFEDPEEGESVGYSEDEEDSDLFEDPEEPFIEESFEDEDDSDLFEDPEESFIEESFEDEEDFSGSNSPATSSPAEVTPLSRQPKVSAEDADIVDLVQDAASALLTGAKRLLKGVVTPKN